MEIEKQEEPIKASFTVSLTGHEMLVVTRALGQSFDSKNAGNYVVYAAFSKACRRFDLEEALA